MKNRIRLFGIIALIAIIGFGLIGCGGPTDPGNTDPVTSTVALNGAIAEAQKLADDTEDKVLGDDTVPADVPIGTEYWLQADWDALNAAIATAEAALNASTQTAVNNAATALANAIEAFNDAVKIGEKNSGFTEEQVQNLIDTAEALTEAVNDGDIIISVDGSEVDPSDLWVTQDDVDALQEAIDALKEAKEAADQEDIDQAYLDLQNAIDDFEEAKKPGTKETGGDDPCDCEHGEDCECDKEWKHDDDHHWSICECGTEFDDKAEHDWDNPDYVIDDPANCIAKGSKTRTCTVCGKADTQEIAINENAHQWGEEEFVFTTLTESEKIKTCTLNASHTETEDAEMTLAEYLQASTQGGTTADPIPLKLAIDLGDMSQIDTGWWELLGILNTAGKYVELDLLDCEMDSTQFNPAAGYYSSPIQDGKDKIIAITLPTAGTTIAQGRYTSTGGEYSTFDNFTNLESVTIPDSYTAIPIGTFGLGNFSNLTTRPAKLKSVSIGNGVESIGDFAFYGTSLTSIDIPDSVTSIGDYAFVNCTSLTSVTIGDGVTSIGDGAFGDCTSLTSVTINAKNINIGNNCFSGSGLKSVTIGDGVESVTIDDNSGFSSSGPFSGCPSLESITIPFVGQSATATGAEALFGYIFGTPPTGGGTATDTETEQYYGDDSITYYIPTSLRTVVIGGESIPEDAFDSCTNLTSVTIRNSVTSIGDYAFYGCSSLTSVTVDPNNPNYASQNNIVYDKAMTTLIFAAGGISGSVTIPDSVTSIGTGAFSGCTGLTSVTIPDSVTSIGLGAFSQCTSLASVTFGNSVTSIGAFAFSQCTSLASVTFQRADTTIAANNSFPSGASLLTAYAEGGIGTYTRAGTPPISNTVPWVKQD